MVFSSWMPYFSMLRWASANFTKASLAAAWGSRTPMTEKTSPNAEITYYHILITSITHEIRDKFRSINAVLCFFFLARGKMVSFNNTLFRETHLCESERAQKKLWVVSLCAPSALQSNRRVKRQNSSLYYFHCWWQIMSVHTKHLSKLWL